MSDLHSRLRAVEVKLAEESGRAKAIRAQLESAENEAIAQEQLAMACEEACTVIGKYADSRQTEIRTLIEQLVTKGLQEVFED